MSIRSLKYRMKVVKEKYSNMPSLLNKVGNKWQIHNTIISTEFMPKYKKKQTNIMNHQWETLITWNMANSYDIKYHQQLITEVKDELPSVNIGYVIELDGRGVNHIHALTDGFKDEVQTAVVNVLGIRGLFDVGSITHTDINKVRVANVVEGNEVSAPFFQCACVAF